MSMSYQPVDGLYLIQIMDEMPAFDCGMVALLCGTEVQALSHLVGGRVV